MASVKNECVVLLHGLGPALGNLAVVEKSLKREGYATLNLKYPSLRYDIEKIVKWLDQQPKFKNVWIEFDKIHFVTLSMGGIVLQNYLCSQRVIQRQKVGRVIMLGPPHGGSEMADLVCKTPLSIMIGPAGRQLTTGQRQNKMRPWYELGIIAGKKFSSGPVFLGPNDGLVSVESTKLDGMKDHIELVAMHGFLGWNASVRHQIVEFLKNGKFDHET